MKKKKGIGGYFCSRHKLPPIIPWLSGTNETRPMADSQSYPQGVSHPGLAGQETVMRDVVKKVLAEWLTKFERQTKANDEYDEYRESQTKANDEYRVFPVDPDPDRFKEHDFGDIWLSIEN